MKAAAMGALVLALPVALDAADAFRVEGSGLLGSEGVRRALARFDLRLERPVRGPDADDAAFYLAEALRDEGFPSALVHWRVEGGVAVFHIEEGARQTVGQTAFSGGAGVARARQRAIVEAVMRQEARAPLGRIPYVERAVESAVERLRQAFANDGYVDAHVSVETSARGSRVDLVFAVEQGVLHVVQSVQVTGLPAGVVFEPGAIVGHPYHPGAEAGLQAQLLDILRSKGYFEAHVAAGIRVHRGGGTVLALAAEPGRRFRLGALSVEGLGRTGDAAVRRKLRLRAGAPFDQTALDEGLRRLWLTGAFSSIAVDPAPRGDGTVDLGVQIGEAPARQVVATLGYGQWERAFATLEYSDSNFLGTLNRFFLEGAISTRSAGVSGGLSDPSLLGTHARGTATAYFLRKETPAYRSTFYGAAAVVERRFEKLGNSVWRAGFEWRATEDTILFGDESLRDTPSDYRLGALTFGQVWDRRNDVLTPMSGYSIGWEGAFASPVFFGDVSFLRLRGQATVYLPLRPIEPERPLAPFVALNARGGIIAPFEGAAAVPVQERFFLGGPDSVRSFQLDGMAPRGRDGAPIGGLCFAQVNAELQVPLWRAIYAVGFLDAGNLAESAAAWAWPDTRVAAGAGLRFYTPVGAVRLDYGANLIRGPGDPVGAWQFGFGFTF